MTTNNLRIKQLIAAYLHFKEVYETDLNEEQLTNVRNIIHDFSSFVDEFVDEFGDGDDDEDSLTVEDNGLYILNDETGEMEKYDWNYIDNISSSNDDEEQNSNPATTNNEYMGDEFDYQYDKARQYKHN
jgi:hypothetical protein